MKKNVIALLMAVVMASGSIGTVPALAAETTAQEAVIAEEETIEEAEVPSEETDTIEMPETTAETTVDVEEGTVDSEEAPVETEEAVTDESTEDSSEEKSAEGIEEEASQDSTEPIEEAEIIEESEVVEEAESEEAAETSTFEEQDGETSVESAAENEVESKDSLTAQAIETGSFNGHKYAIYNIGGSYDDAKAFCEAQGGYLASISSKEENDFLYNFITSQGIKNAYFGYTDQKTEGEWLWINGEESGYTNWAINEPNSERDNEDYAEFYYKYTSGEWNDGSFGNGTSGDEKNFICEWGWEIKLFPEPGTKDVDINSTELVCYADFMCDIAYNDGFAYLFEVGNDNDLVDEIFLGEPDEGKCSIENGNRLILRFSRDKLKKGKSYYIRIEENAIKRLDQNIGYPGLAKDIWTFSTGNLFSPIEPVSIDDGTFSFRSLHKNDDSIDYTFDYDDNWVFSDSDNDRYKLMSTSICVAMAAYGAKEDGGSGPANIKSMMDTMKFDYVDNDTNVSVYYPTPTKANVNTIGTAIGMKNLKMPDGKTRSIILVAVRGGGYGTEWGGNFRVGDDSFLNSTGFNTAALQVCSRLRSFVNDNTQYISDDLRIWITGYSRAGATSNLAASYLINGTEKINGVSSDEVMAFCFECPMTTTDQNAGDGMYDNIINIVNPNDFVPKVPLAKWGFKRYGKTYSIPCDETTSEYYSTYYQPMMTAYKDILKRNNINKEWGYYREYLGQASLLDEYFDYLGTSIDRNKYASKYQDTAVDIAASCLGGQGEPDWVLAAPQLLSLFRIAAVRPASTAKIKTGFTDGNPAPMPSAHYSELCLSWINSIPDFDSFTPKLYRIATVKCPVDITVRDSNGKVVGQIENDEVAEIENGIAARIDEDGRKIFILPEDEECTIDIKATDNGKVNYTIKEYNFESQTTEMAVIYKDVEVSAGDELIAKVAEAPEGNEADYTLQHAEDMEEITADEVLAGDEIVEYTVDVESDGNGTVTGGGSYVKGELATVTATVEAGNSFEGWYLGDSCVSKEELYRFTVEADTVLKAVFSAVDDSISGTVKSFAQI